ncbi:MAG: TetR/AcrR family transcriptional regulator [Acidobacteriota bacterium]
MPRPRSAAADEAILESAKELFTESGLAAVTMEAIARRAGVGKQTVYRRYANRDAVLAAGWLREAETLVEVPRGRSLESDLRRFLERLFEALQSTGDALRRLLGQAQFDDSLREAVRDAFIEQRRSVLMELIERHLGPDRRREVETVVDMLYGAMWYRLLAGHAPLDRELARRLAKQAVRGLRVP